MESFVFVCFCVRVCRCGVVCCVRMCVYVCVCVCVVCGVQWHCVSLGEVHAVRRRDNKFLRGSTKISSPAGHLEVMGRADTQTRSRADAQTRRHLQPRSRAAAQPRSRAAAQTRRRACAHVRRYAGAQVYAEHMHLCMRATLSISEIIF